MACRCWAVALAVLVVAVPPGLAVTADGAMTNTDIVRMTRAGVGESVIVAMIESSETDFDTGVDSVLDLAEADVGDAVIAAMVAAGPHQATLARLGDRRLRPRRPLVTKRIARPLQAPSRVALSAARSASRCIRAARVRRWW